MLGVGGEELGRGQQRCGHADGDDDVARAPRCAPDERLHRETDADVSLDGERDRQPDASVTARVRQLVTDQRLVRHVRTRRT